MNEGVSGVVGQTGGLIVRDLRAFARRWRQGARALTPAFPVFGAVMATLAAMVAVRWLAHYDGRLSLAAQSAPSWLVSFFRTVTDVGTSGWMFALALGLAAIASWARPLNGGRRDLALAAFGERAMFLVATLAISGLLGQAIKHVVGRARPRYLTSEGPFAFHAFSFKASYASFPSGHATTMFAMAIALGFLLPGRRWGLLAFAFLIALSRVFVGAHYPTDVLGGALLGAASAFLVARAFARRDIALRYVGSRLAPRAPGVIAGAWRAFRKKEK